MDATDAAASVARLAQTLPPSLESLLLSNCPSLAVLPDNLLFASPKVRDAISREPRPELRLSSA